MRAKHARLIRIGIMSKCLPSICGGPDDPWEVPDYGRLRKYQRDWYAYNYIPLVRRANHRTNTWYSRKQKS